MIKNIKMLLLVSLTFVACTTKEEEVIAPINSSDGLPLTAGSADFSNYVAVGNSLSAGFSDGALFIEGQKTSWTAILAEQFKLVGGGEYKIPFMKDNVGGFLDPITGSQNFTYLPRLYFNTLAQPSAAPALVPMMSSAANSTILTGGFNNMGVPGAKVWHLTTAGYGQVNPYFGRFASSPGAKIIDDAVAQKPTFFSLWIGNNDVLSYALSGGTGANGGFGVNDITDPQVFAAKYTEILSDVNGLRKNNSKGVIANIPYVTTIPHFTTVPYNPVRLPQANVDALNTAYAQYNGALQQLTTAGLITDAERVRRTIVFSATTPNPVVILDEDLTPLTSINPALTNMRFATNEDLIVLGGASFIGTLVNNNQQLVNGVSVPLEDKWVLTKTEISNLKTATDAFNITIKGLADQYGLAFVDANKILSNVATTGLSSNGFTIKSTYVTGGAFSLDGVHPSPRGYALIANEFIKVINAKYGSNLKGVDVGNYRVLFPKVL
jgi:hypothetical protein